MGALSPERLELVRPSPQSAWKLNSPWPISGHKPTVPKACGMGRSGLGVANVDHWSKMVGDQAMTPRLGNRVGHVPPSNSLHSAPPKIKGYHQRHVIGKLLDLLFPTRASLNNSKHWWDWPRRRVKSVVSWIIPSRSCMATGIQKSSIQRPKPGVGHFDLDAVRVQMRWPTSWPTLCSKFHSDDRKTPH